MNPNETSVDNILLGVKRHKLKHDGYFGREQKKQRTMQLANHFGTEENAVEYRGSLVTYACDTWSRDLFVALTDPLLDAKCYPLLERLHKVDQLLEQQAEAGKMLFLEKQKQEICSLFEELKFLAPYDQAIKNFARSTPPALRSTGFIEFWYGKDRRSTLRTEGFREKVRLTLSLLPTVPLDQAPDAILTPYIVDQIDKLLEDKGKVNEIIYKDSYMNELLCVITFIKQQRQAIYISKLQTLLTHFTERDEETGKDTRYTIDSIDDIFTSTHQQAESFYGLATVYGKPKKVLFDKENLVTRIDLYQIESCAFYRKGTILLANTRDPYDRKTKQCFIRLENQRMHLYKYYDFKENKTCYIDSVETIETDEDYLYVYVQTGKTPDTRDVKRISLDWFFV